MAVYITRRDRDEKAVESLIRVFMPRIRSGVIRDVHVYLPQWKRLRRFTWPCEIRVLYLDSRETKDTEWFYNKFMTELGDAGFGWNDVKLSLEAVDPGEQEIGPGAISIKDLSAEYEKYHSRIK